MLKHIQPSGPMEVTRQRAEGFLDRRAAEIMPPGPEAIDDHALAAEALRTMNEGSITPLCVIEDGRPTGTLRMHDYLRAGIA